MSSFRAPKYIFGEGIEEIDINSWRDIEVQYAGGRCEKLAERFNSPEHCINVLRRMLHVSGTILDDQSPVVIGTLAENIRIAVMKYPVVDASVGAAASIRIVNPHNMAKEDFVNGGTATSEMLDFLAECIRYGISVCVAGATSSGKTTIAGWLLTTIPDSKRIFTIENGSRELSLVREKDGKVTNSVVHTLTRNSENEVYRIDQIDLVDISLRFNPDVIVVGEMRGAEANAAQEVARTGVSVVTTIHSNSCESTYAGQMGFTVVGSSQDLGSGLSMERPGLLAVREAVNAKTAQVLLVTSIGRIGRDTASATKFISTLSSGVRIYSPMEGELLPLLNQLPNLEMQ